MIVSTKKKTNKKTSEYMRELGRKGGKATAKRGKEYFSKIGKKGYEALAKKKRSQ